MEKFEDLIATAEKVFKTNFPMETCFERAIFYSWACQLEDCCSYCYMSTLPKEKRTNTRVRSFASLLAETILCKNLGWDYGFLSGGVGAFSEEKIIDLLDKTLEITKEPVWINIGTLKKEQMLHLKKYIKGIIGTIEILDPHLHDKICPSKPIHPVEEMFKDAKEIGIDCGMTLILGLGETIEQFSLLKEFIKKHDIKKIHIYGLNPQKGTIFEDKSPPTAEYQAEYIAKTRIEFPKIDIQCGIWETRVDRVSLLLKAGSNSISKIPALKMFGNKNALELERQASIAGRKFKGTITKIPSIDWEKIVYELPFKKNLKEDILKKLMQYINSMKSSQSKRI